MQQNPTWEANMDPTQEDQWPPTGTRNGLPDVCGRACGGAAAQRRDQSGDRPPLAPAWNNDNQPLSTCIRTLNKKHQHARTAI